MENKEIYIDDVDVSGCENYIGANTKTHNCTLYDGYLRPCKGAYCYYKNWQRKEQECEKAKQNAQDTYDLWQALIESFNILQGEKIKLEQECEQLKEELQKYKDNEQQEKEMLKLYNKFDGSSLIEKRSPYGQF